MQYKIEKLERTIQAALKEKSDQDRKKAIIKDLENQIKTEQEAKRKLIEDKQLVLRFMEYDLTYCLG